MELSISRYNATSVLPSSSGGTGAQSSLGWIANWGQDNGNQTVRYIESGNSYSYGMSTENANGLLVEAGLDYTTFNFSDTSVGVFVRGGPVFWGSDLGTSWRAWGGLSLTF